MYEFRLLLKSVPSIVITIFVVAVFVMNLLANKSINLGVNWLALDCGFLVSWVAFLCMDILTKHFGPKAASSISIFAIFLNLCVSLLFFVVSLIDGVWGQYFQLGELEVINQALDGTLASSWYVVVGSTVALTASALINNTLNYFIGLLCKNKDNFLSFALRSYASTIVAQFADNFLFAFIVSHFFFGWSIVQCLTCAATGMIVELVCEIIFSPIGYRVCKKWANEEVGKQYLEYKESL
ncbi:MAG: VUT family protein [Clostridia bacterium]|nr:VUT family protein [Clostridia bacterium]